MSVWIFGVMGVCVCCGAGMSLYMRVAVCGGKVGRCVWGGGSHVARLCREMNRLATDSGSCWEQDQGWRSRVRCAHSRWAAAPSAISWWSIWKERVQTWVGGVVCVFICVRSRWAVASSAIAWWSVLKQRDAHRREGLCVCTYIQTQAFVCTLSMSSCSTSHFMICFERDGRTCVGGSCVCV